MRLTARGPLCWNQLCWHQRASNVDAGSHKGCVNVHFSKFCPKGRSKSMRTLPLHHLQCASFTPSSSEMAESHPRRHICTDSCLPFKQNQRNERYRHKRVPLDRATQRCTIMLDERRYVMTKRHIRVRAMRVSYTLHPGLAFSGTLTYRGSLDLQRYWYQKIVKGMQRATLSSHTHET